MGSACSGKRRDVEKVEADETVAQGEGHFHENYAIGANLGAGGFGAVFLGRERRTRQEVAVKKFPLREFGGDDIDSNSEVNALRKLNHTQIIKVYSYFIEEEATYVVMELIPGGGNLMMLLQHDSGKASTRFTEENLRTVMTHMCEALNYALSKRIIHRDIKPDNILVRNWKTWDVVLAGFNPSKVMVMKIKECHWRAVLGPDVFEAPEIWKNERCNYKCDIWSLGVVAFLFLSWGKVPYDPINPYKYDYTRGPVEGFFSQELRFKPTEQYNSVSDEAKTLIKRMLSVDPVERPDYDELLTDKFSFMTKEFEGNLFDLNRGNNGLT